MRFPGKTRSGLGQGAFSKEDDEAVVVDGDALRRTGTHATCREGIGKVGISVDHGIRTAQLWKRKWPCPAAIGSQFLLPSTAGE